MRESMKGHRMTREKVEKLIAAYRVGGLVDKTLVVSVLGLDTRPMAEVGVLNGFAVYSEWDVLQAATDQLEL